VQGLLKLVDDSWKADAGSFKLGYTKAMFGLVVKDGMEWNGVVNN
jgi:hypothetical protein